MDYYSILQVHPEAEREVIQGAYKRLCRKYHPDVNPAPQAAETIARINLAYEVLGDEAKRRHYHAEWLRRRGLAAAAPAASVRERIVYRDRPAPPPADQGTPPARQAVHDYFLHLSARRFSEAFRLVSDADKRHFQYEGFAEWQESVSALYELGRFSLSLFKRHPDFSLGGGTRCRAEEYRVTVLEKNKATGRVTEYSFVKYAVWENGQWKIYLGYRDLTPLVMQLRAMAASPGEDVMLSRWEDYKQKTDMTVGLPNRLGFEALLQPEAYRHKRYARPFTVAVFQVSLPDRAPDTAQAARLIKFVGYLVSRHVRATDQAGYLGGGLFCVLFTETGRKAATMASRRVLRAVRQDVSACFDFDVLIRAGLMEYGGQPLDSMISSCLNTIGNACAAFPPRRETAAR